MELYLFCTTYVIFLFFFKSFLLYYIGSISLGIGIGLIPPIILNLITNTQNVKTNEKNIGLYNITTAVSSAIGPMIAELIYHTSTKLLLLSWVVLAISLLLLIIKVISNKKINITENVYTDSAPFKFISLRLLVLLLFLTAISISYGTIISYLPIYFSHIHLSVGIYYFLFWLFYSIAQGSHFLNSNWKSLSIISLGMIISMAIISYSHQSILSYISGILFGYLYGSIFRIYYSIMSKIKNPTSRNNGYGIVGLMSYIGVGISQIFISPFLNFPINNIFFLSSTYLIPFFILMPLILGRKQHEKTK
ncbi:MFS transporter [Fructilactobacillus fructivorans]|uniref:MFS transporter n=1 Tax=Fructilactobacillus fructivorans TaxID=1614 RepID=UPI00070AFF21|nr:MFS transporter [Fructilactobacillus fructivorans]KRN41361.1 hypothetical protein IV51_GL000687 [Fructilactobacillus fructivorans]